MSLISDTTGQGNIIFISCCDLEELLLAGLAVTCTAVLTTSRLENVLRLVTIFPCRSQAFSAHLIVK